MLTPEPAAAAPAAGGAPAGDHAAAGGERRPPKKTYDRAPRVPRGDKEAAYTAGKDRVFDKKSHPGTGRAYVPLSF